MILICVSQFCSKPDTICIDQNNMQTRQKKRGATLRKRESAVYHRLLDIPTVSSTHMKVRSQNGNRKLRIPTLNFCKLTRRLLRVTLVFLHFDMFDIKSRCLHGVVAGVRAIRSGTGNFRASGLANSCRWVRDMNDHMSKDIESKAEDCTTSRISYDTL